MSKVHIASTPVPYTHSLRVLLTIARGQVQILRVTRVAMRALAAPSHPPQENSAGYWFEIRDTEGKLLYHRPFPHGDVESIEVFDDPDGGTIRRVPATDAERKVELIVPDLATSSEITVHGPRTAAERTRPSAMLVRYSMADLRKRASGGQASQTGQEKDSTGGER